MHIATIMPTPKRVHVVLTEKQNEQVDTLLEKGFATSRAEAVRFLINKGMEAAKS
jgi:Arc/MetJ-type ribon-helix-helix transcriptional regulator